MPIESHMLRFSCTSCFTRLQVPIFYAGSFAPCPCCGTLVLAPAIKTLAVVPLPTTTGSVSETALPLAKSSTFQGNTNVRKDSPTARQKASSEFVSSRLILADNAISHDEVERKDHGNFIRMCVFLFLVILLIVAVFWLLKSLGNESFG